MMTSTRKPHPPASTAGKVAGALLLVVIGFQVALAAGAPWGIASYGGQRTGVLPVELRVSSAVAAGFYLLLVLASATPLLNLRLRSPLFYGAAALMFVGAILNIASQSVVERLLWTPVTIALVLAFWQAARLSGSSAPRRQRAHPVGISG